ncbi:N6-mAMP deaminase isoform X1 [Arachis duranensis]|uniref:N6-mAMP deaminase isoform X1 n=1 Tax=Arachis duranensis TaxID=130453 RepID=A0A6P4CWX1_ARADU|nr:N6-mAMP deaminase isoform X1 [Arachis duranensis]
MEWWVSMPKVELHAHLNGSIRDSTLLELTKALGEKGVINFSQVEHIIMKYNRSVKEVFQLFDLIRILTTDHAILTRITREVIEDFASENVVYLELRTTPKRNDAIGMTKGSYFEAVLEGLRSVTSVDVNFIPHDKEDSRTLFSPNNGSSRKRIYVRLLLSIDRRETTEAAMETVKLALEMKQFGVVGIDLSGNPLVGDWNTYLPALKFARNQGLYVSLHCGEIPNPKEIHQMLDFKPERIGHAICFEKEHWEILKSSKIPVEICLTSNIRTLTVRSIQVHHFVGLYKTKHPVVLCTDDSGVFSTCLSKEYKIAADAFVFTGLGKRESFELSRNAVELIFAERQVKEDLTKYFDSVAKTMGVYKNKIHSYEL